MYPCHILFLGVCDCCDGSDELPVDIRTGTVSKQEYEEQKGALMTGWVVDCPNTCGTTSALHSILPQVLDFNRRTVQEKASKKKPDLSLSHTMRQHIFPKAPKDQKRRNVMGSWKARANRFYVGIVLLMVAIFLPLFCCLCSTHGIQNIFRNVYYNSKLTIQYVLQKCGCLRVNAEYTFNKDATHMV